LVAACGMSPISHVLVGYDALVRRAAWLEPS
jgi:hypothetical protein